MANVQIETHQRVMTVILSRPEVRNAVDRATADELAAAFRQFDRDSHLDVAVLCGDGGHFCAGADLKAIARGDFNRVDETGDGPMGPTRMLLSKPVIAAISGYAVAGGLELALWCDLRVADEDATLGVFCRRVGVPLIDGGTVRLPRLIGMSRAMDLILTGREVAAREAWEIGLVNYLSPSGTARAYAEKLAQQLCELPQTCLRHDRLSLHEQAGMSFDQAMLNELRHGMHALAGETQAGARAFVEKSKEHDSSGVPPG